MDDSNSTHSDAIIGDDCEPADEPPVPFLQKQQEEEEEKTPPILMIDNEQEDEEESAPLTIDTTNNDKTIIGEEEDATGDYAASVGGGVHDGGEQRTAETGEGHASFASSIHSNQSTAQESQTSGSSQNVCAHCGRESVEIKPPAIMVDDTAASSSSSSMLLLMTLPSQEAAKMRKQHEAAAAILMRTAEEEAAEWIFCDVCRKWFHTMCVDVQQYELALIDKYHCPSCRFGHGDSQMKIKQLSHRHAFDDASERALPMQIGTEAWTRNFKNEYMRIAEAPSPDLIRLYENGRDLMRAFNFAQCWTEPIKVVNKKGLGLRMPEDPYFDVLDVLKLLGGHVSVETIDVFAQQSYTMSLDRFYGLWRKRNRDRLYNILSLEFSETKLANIVRSPSLVRELSWAQRFWTNNKNSGGQRGSDEEEEAAAPKIDTDIYAFSDNPTWHPHSAASAQQQQQESARPYVEHFCLMGMRGSYTDFHIDFGGSSVWYHVFRGAKVFFITRPSAPNLEAFLRWQKDKQRSEKFFGDMLPPGEKLYRLHVHEGETLFLPSGWIHSVYTPEDSLVFGGNFLHNLNVSMQIKIYAMEVAADIEERFKFPFFELCNFYAAKNISESLKDSTATGQLAEGVLLDAATALVCKCAEWLRGAPSKFAMFSGTVKQLKRELDRQIGLQRRIASIHGEKTITRDAPPTPLSSSSPAPSEVPMGEHSAIVCGGTQLDIQDLESSWEEGEEMEEEEEEEIEEAGWKDEEGQPSSSTAVNPPKRRRRQFMLQQPDISSSHLEGGGDSALLLKIESKGPVKLKIRLPVPCWRRPSPPPAYQQSTPTRQKKSAASAATIDVDDDGAATVDVGAMFTGRSAHGRRLRPSARIADMVEGGSPLAGNDGQQEGGGGSKNFMAQFTPEERRQIELAEKAAEMDARDGPFSPLSKSHRAKKKRPSQPLDKSERQALDIKSESSKGEGTSSTTAADSSDHHSAATPAPVVEKKPRKGAATAISSRQRLAKKLGLLRKK